MIPTGLSLRTGFLNGSILEAGGFSLDAFMASQSDGLYFDFTKTDRTFQEKIGPSPADDIGEPIGLALNQREWGGRSLAGKVATQPIINDNGDFSNGFVGWPAYEGAIQTLVDGNMSIVSTGLQYSRSSNTIPVVTGKYYHIKYRAKRVTGPAGWVILSYTGHNTGYSVQPLSTEWRTYEFVLKTVDSALSVTLQTDNVASGISLLLDYVEVRELPDKHGVQAVGSLRPTRQTLGAKFDGNDDRLDTGYVPAASAGFICASVTFPSSLAALQVIAGCKAINDRFYLGVTSSTLLTAGVGSASTNLPVPSLLNQTAVLGLSFDGSTVRTFFGDSLLAEYAQAGSVSPGRDMAIGALNNDGGIFQFFGGHINALVAGTESLDLGTYRKIRNKISLT